MIPVTPKPEPPDFDRKVRKKGKAWLEKKGLPTTGPLPPNTKLSPFWHNCLDELHEAYSGVCAYLAVYLMLSVGATVDHFMPSSRDAAGIYEWDNYRLASPRVNSRKKNEVGILDPFTIRPEMFYLEFVTGKIFPNPSLSAAEKAQVDRTIGILGLDLSCCRRTRGGHYLDYKERRFSVDYFRSMSPFVYAETVRQGLLNIEDRP